MLEYDIGSLVISIATFAAWIFFGNLLYHKLPAHWPKALKLPISIVVPMLGLVALTMALGIDMS